MNRIAIVPEGLGCGSSMRLFPVIKGQPDFYAYNRAGLSEKSNRKSSKEQGERVSVAERTLRHAACPVLIVK
jgi:nucleotide-binding universal stress UspA family protein